MAQYEKHGPLVMVIDSGGLEYVGYS